MEGMPMVREHRAAACSLIGLAALVWSGMVRAQGVEAFYRGRTIDMIVGYPPGGSNDLYARIVARHFGEHLPGNPTVVLRGMPGAGSVVAANYIYNVAPKDGTVLGIISPTSPLDEKLGATGVKFESAKFTWIGRAASAVNVGFFSKNGPIQTTEDMFTREAKMAATGAGSTVVVYPTVMNNVLGTKFKLVMGYRGSGEAMLALDRGEADGHSTSLDALNAEHPDWISNGRVRILVQYGLERHPLLPNVPTCIELAKNDEQRDILRVVMSSVEVGKMFFSTPGVPAERTEALRRAFDETMKDPELASDIEKARMDLIPMRGEDLQELVRGVSKISPELLAKVRKIYPQGG
jgi:tripartite-type tricarboxylate transporter receptor subunit TctC